MKYTGLKAPVEKAFMAIVPSGILISETSIVVCPVRVRQHLSTAEKATITSGRLCVKYDYHSISDLHLMPQKTHVSRSH